MKKSDETKKCKYCQTDIPVKAKVCPNCKRTLKGPGCLIYVLSFFIVIGVIFALTINFNSGIQKEISGVSNDSEYITLEEYNNIEMGMSYEEVTNIIGSNGIVSSEVNSNGYEIKIVTWYGKGIAGSNANVTFTNGKASAKAQAGLN